MCGFWRKTHLWIDKSDYSLLYRLLLPWLNFLFFLVQSLWLYIHYIRLWGISQTNNGVFLSVFPIMPKVRSCSLSLLVCLDIERCILLQFFYCNWSDIVFVVFLSGVLLIARQGALLSSALLHRPFLAFATVRTQRTRRVCLQIRCC